MMTEAVEDLTTTLNEAASAAGVVGGMVDSITQAINQVGVLGSLWMEVPASSPAWPRDQSRDLSPNASGGLTPLSPPTELQEIAVAIREQSGVLCFHSR